MTMLSGEASFVPFVVADGDELLPNGVCVFDVTRILAHRMRHPDHTGTARSRSASTLIRAEQRS